MRWKQVSKGNAYSPRIGQLNHTSGNHPITSPIATDSPPAQMDVGSAQSLP